MTTVKIIESGEIRELSVIDANSGLDWSGDMLGNFNAYDGFDDEAELHTMSQETYDWWAEFLPKYEAADEAANEHRKSLDGADAEQFEETLNHATGCDLEDLPAAMMTAIEWSKA